MCGNCEYERYEFFNEMESKNITDFIDATVVKKDLYKNKSNAIFQYYETGNLWYRITTSLGVFDIPIAVTHEVPNESLGVYVMDLSSEIGSTQFGTEIKASDLNRWIEKSIKANTYRVISLTI